MLNAWDYVNVRYLNQKGQGMVEYALILAFVVVIAAFLTGNDGIGQAIQNVFQTVTNQLNQANQQGGGN
ncbi:MAG: hypothetical protein IJ741_10075 [Schwartzia sp.]|nr:hypothetical protein [Schwartzia sp. (in: firmicutes)]